MRLDIGQLTVSTLAPGSAPGGPTAAEGRREAAPATAAARAGDRVELTGSVPPPEVLDAVNVASARVAELAEANRELHFELDEDSGRVIIQVRQLDGTILRTIPPSAALDVLSGGEL